MHCAWNTAKLLPQPPLTPTMSGKAGTIMLTCGEEFQASFLYPTRLFLNLPWSASPSQKETSDGF